MKSFSSFISEKRTDLPGGNPTNMPQGDIDALRRQAAGGPREPLSTDAPQKRTIRKRIIKTPEGNIETNIPPDSPRTPEEQITRAERGRTRLSSRTQQIAGDVRANPSSSPEARRAASNLLGGVPDTEPRVGTGVRSGTGAAYRANQPPKALGDKIDKLVTSIQQNARTPQRMSAAYDRNLARDANAVIQGLGDERRGETAAGNREFRQLRYGRGRSGPATTLRTPAQASKWLEGINKGYFNPQTGKPTASGIQRHIDMRAAGGTGFGRFTASGADPRASLASVQNAIQRAVSGDRSARREVNKSYKSLTTNYRPPAVVQNTPAAPKPPVEPKAFKPSPTPEAPKPTPVSAPSGGTSTSTPSTGTNTPSTTKTKEVLKLSLGAPPSTPAPAAPKPTPAPAAPKPTPAVKADLEVLKKPLNITKPLPTNVIGGTKPTPTPAAPKPKVVAKLITGTKPAAMSTDQIGKAFDQVLKNREARKAAEKAKGALKFAKAVKGAGTALSVVGSGLEAKGGYETARREGASQRRALGAGAARGLGSFIGGGVGATLGSALGLPGAIAGGAAGYGLGANVGTAAYKAVTGDPLKKLTTKDVLTNVRKAVPYEVRKQVPAGARKVFKDFVTQAGKSYGNWQRSQQQQGGNK